MTILRKPIFLCFCFTAFLIAACSTPTPQQDPATIDAGSDVDLAPVSERWRKTWTSEKAGLHRLGWLEHRQSVRLMEALWVANEHLGDAAQNYAQSLVYAKRAVSALVEQLEFRELGNGKQPRWLDSFYTVSWESSLWSAVQQQTGDATTDPELAIARQLLISQLARGLVLRTELVRQKKLAVELLDVQRRYAAFAHRGWKLGRIERDALMQAEEREKRAEITLRKIEEAGREADNSIRSLLVAIPDDVDLASLPLPDIKHGIPAGLDVALLERRPDVARARRASVTLLESDGLGSFPAVSGLTLTGRAGWPTRELTSAVNRKTLQWFTWNSSPAIDAEVVSLSTRPETQIFTRALHDALKDVRRNLLRDRLLASQENLIYEEKDNAYSGLQVARGLYNAGRSDLANLLNHQAGVLRWEMLLLRSNGQRDLQRMNVDLALGGDLVDQADE